MQLRRLLCPFVMTFVAGCSTFSEGRSRIENEYLVANPSLSPEIAAAIKSRRVILGMTHEQMAVATGIEAIG